MLSSHPIYFQYFISSASYNEYPDPLKVSKLVVYFLTTGLLFPALNVVTSSAIVPGAPDPYTLVRLKDDIVLPVKLVCCPACASFSSPVAGFQISSSATQIVYLFHFLASFPITFVKVISVYGLPPTVRCTELSTVPRKYPETLPAVP